MTRSRTCLHRTKFAFAILAASIFTTAPLHALESTPDLPFMVIVSDATEDRAAALEVAAARAAWRKALRLKTWNR